MYKIVLSFFFKSHSGYLFLEQTSLHYAASSPPSLFLSASSLSTLYTTLGSGPPFMAMSVAVALLQVGNDPIAVMTVTPPINQTILCVFLSGCVYVCVD